MKVDVLPCTCEFWATSQFYNPTGCTRHDLVLRKAAMTAFDWAADDRNTAPYKRTKKETKLLPPTEDIF